MLRLHPLEVLELFHLSTKIIVMSSSPLSLSEFSKELREIGEKKLSSDGFGGFWKTTQDAEARTFSQIGPSACGATATLTVLKALDGGNFSEEKVRKVATVRLRKKEAPLPQYLESRSLAGCTGEDLCQDVSKFSEGRITSKFISLYPPPPNLSSPSDLAEWLCGWFESGGLAVGTFNNQMYGADAWHHQFLYAVEKKEAKEKNEREGQNDENDEKDEKEKVSEKEVSEKGRGKKEDSGGTFVHCANPIEKMEISDCFMRLSTPSTLIIRPSDVLSRLNRSNEDLTIFERPTWKTLNVLSQIDNLKSQDPSPLPEELGVALLFSHTTKMIKKNDYRMEMDKEMGTLGVVIPASYCSGISLFAPKESKAAAWLTKSLIIEN